MEIPLSILTAYLLLATVLSCFTLFLWVPALFRSVARHRLWKARDRIFDAHVCGALPDIPSIRLLIGFSENLIINISNITFLTSINQRRLARKVDAGSFWVVLLKDLSDVEKAIVEGYRQEVGAALGIKALLGSASGITASLILVPPVVFCVVASMVVKEGVTRTLKSPVTFLAKVIIDWIRRRILKDGAFLDPSLTPMGHAKPDPKELAHLQG